MATTTQTRLDAYLAAEAQILDGQAVAFEGRSLTRASLNEVRRAIVDLQRQVRVEARTAVGSRGPRHLLADLS